MPRTDTTERQELIKRAEDLKEKLGDKSDQWTANVLVPFLIGYFKPELWLDSELQICSGFWKAFGHALKDTENERDE